MVEYGGTHQIACCRKLQKWSIEEAPKSAVDSNVFIDEKSGGEMWCFQGGPCCRKKKSERVEYRSSHLGSFVALEKNLEYTDKARFVINQMADSRSAM